MESLWTFLFQFREELLLFCGFWFLVGGLDDLAVDLIWICRAAWRWLFRYRKRPAMKASELPAPQAQAPLAIFIPAW